MTNPNVLRLDQEPSPEVSQHDLEDVFISGRALCEAIGEVRNVEDEITEGRGVSLYEFVVDIDPMLLREVFFTQGKYQPTHGSLSYVRPRRLSLDDEPGSSLNVSIETVLPHVAFPSSTEYQLQLVDGVYSAKEHFEFVTESGVDTDVESAPLHSDDIKKLRALFAVIEYEAAM